MADSAPLDSRAPPKDLSHHISRNVASREASSVKRFYKYFLIPGIGQLAGGLPNRYYFPFDTLEAKVASPDRWKPTPNIPIDPPEDGAASISKSKDQPKQQSSTIVVPHASTETNVLKRIDLETALQYGQAQGYPPLYAFLKQLTNDHMHPNIPYKGGAEIALTVGNTDGWSKVLMTFTNEWDKDKDWLRDREGILVEKFVYANAVAGAKPRGLNIVPVDIDDEGMKADGPGGLRDVLGNWDDKRGKRPHLIYTVTMGHNPTSGVLSLKRRRELYEICSKYDVLICEDDPYWYLQFPSSAAKLPPKPAEDPLPDGWKSSGYEFLDSLAPSSLNIDTDGRVIRLDTFSKTVAPGCRLGWITAQPAFIERILRLTETSTQQPSGFVQAMVAELIMGPAGTIDAAKTTPGWKADGWVRWVEGLRGNYERRMIKMCDVLDKGREMVKAGRRGSLSSAMAESSIDDDEDWAVVEKTTMYSFDWPIGGMFVWLQVHFENHPLAGKVEGMKLSQALWMFWTHKPYLVLVSPGMMFSATPEIRDKEGYRYFRLCFAAADEETITPVSERLVEGVKAFWRIKSVKVIEDLLKEAEEDPTAAHAELAGMQDIGNMAGICF